MSLLHAAAGWYSAGKWKESKGIGRDLLQVTIQVLIRRRSSLVQATSRNRVESLLRFSLTSNSGSIFFVFSHIPHTAPAYYSRKISVRVLSVELQVSCSYIRNIKCNFIEPKIMMCKRVGTLIVATIYLQLIQNRYMFRRA